MKNLRTCFYLLTCGDEQTCGDRRTCGDQTTCASPQSGVQKICALKTGGRISARLTCGPWICENEHDGEHQLQDQKASLFYIYYTQYIFLKRPFFTISFDQFELCF